MVPRHLPRRVRRDAAGRRDLRAARDRAGAISPPSPLHLPSTSHASHALVRASAALSDESELRALTNPREQSVGGLIDGAIYYSLITATNNAGATASRSTDGFSVDLSPPECGTVMDGPSYDRLWIGPTVAGANLIVDETDGTEIVLGDLAISWIDFSDWNSGIAGYAAAIIPASMVGSANRSNTLFVNLGMAGSLERRMPIVRVHSPASTALLPQPCFHRPASTALTSPPCHVAGARRSLLRRRVELGSPRQRGEMLLGRRYIRRDAAG